MVYDASLLGLTGRGRVSAPAAVKSSTRLRRSLRQASCLILDHYYIYRDGRTRRWLTLTPSPQTLPLYCYIFVGSLMPFLVYYLFDCLIAEYTYLPSLVHVREVRYSNTHVSRNLKAYELRNEGEEKRCPVSLPLFFTSPSASRDILSIRLVASFVFVLHLTAIILAFQRNGIRFLALHHSPPLAQPLRAYVVTHTEPQLEHASE
jgi:hypothetical protein